MNERTAQSKNAIGETSDSWDVTHVVGFVTGDPDGFLKMRGYNLYVCKQGILARPVSRLGFLHEMGRAIPVQGGRLISGVCGRLREDATEILPGKSIPSDDASTELYPWTAIQFLAIRKLKLRPMVKILIQRRDHKQDVFVMPNTKWKEGLALVLESHFESCVRQVHWWF